MSEPNSSRATSRCGERIFCWVPEGTDFPNCVLVEDHWGRCAAEGWTPDAGSYNDEDTYNCDTEKYDRRAIKVMCPGCGRMGAPLCSFKTERTGGDWRWVGCDHRRPESDWKTTCRCGTTYTFTTYTPQ